MGRIGPIGPMGPIRPIPRARLRSCQSANTLHHHALLPPGDRRVGPADSPNLLRNRWVQLAAGITGMVAVTNFQYAWTLFALPLEERHGWSQVAIQDALILWFVLAQTW